MRCIQFQGHSVGEWVIFYLWCGGLQQGATTPHLAPSKQTHYWTQSLDEPQTKKHTQAVEASHHYRVYPLFYQPVRVWGKEICNEEFTKRYTFLPDSSSPSLSLCLLTPSLSPNVYTPFKLIRKLQGKLPIHISLAGMTSTRWLGWVPAIKRPLPHPVPAT